MSKEFTREEVRDKFLKHVRHLINYWDSTRNGGDQANRLSGLAFSILVAIDGCAGGLPKFILAPDPHPDDKEFHKNEDENWFPENHANVISADISGGLHELL
jgi:hypothetical protein